MPKSFYLSILIFVFIFAANAQAQSVSPTVQTGLTINVKDSLGASVQGAEVILSSRGQKIRNGETGADGTVSIEKLPAGDYRITVIAGGFPVVSKDVSLVEGGTTTADLVLSPGGISETVSVTATRGQVTSEDTAVPVSVIGREDIERKAVNTVGDIFRTLPGTSTANEGGFQVRPRIRGLDSNRVLILVDGERLNNSRTSTGQSGVETGIVDISQVDSVEVVRGSGSVLYGTDALGGTINIITHDVQQNRDGGFRFGGALNTFFSSNESGRRGNLALTGSGKYFAFRASQSMERFGNYFVGKNDGVVPADILAQGGVTADGEALNSQSHGSDTTITTRVFVNDQNTLKFGYDRRRAANIGSSTLVGTFNGFFPESNRDKVNARFDSVVLKKYLQRWSVSAFHQTQLRNFTNILTVSPIPPSFPGFYQNSETITDTGTTGAELQSSWTLGSRNTMVAGMSFFRDINQDRRSVVTGSTPTSSNHTTSNTKSVPDAKLTNFAGFAQDEYRITKRLTLFGGIRVDSFKTVAQPTTGFAIPALRQDQIDALGIGGLASGLNVSNKATTGDVGGVYKLTSDVSLSARLGRSFRTPNIFETFFTDTGSVAGFVVGNPSLRPESGLNFDTSVKVKTTRFAASATYFNNTYKDLLATVPANDRRGCPVFITRPGTVYDANNCLILSSPPGPAPVRVYQTQNIDHARIQGFEAEFEAPIKISLGYLTPNGNLSYLRGDNTDLNVPLDFISPLRANVGVRWNNYGKSYFFDYYARLVAKQDRLSRSFLSPVNQGGNGGPEAGFVTHNVGGGYYHRRERFNFNINLGISNIFNRGYSEQFVYAPARGRSFTIGTSWEIK